jgi:hypothetical protein
MLISHTLKLIFIHNYKVAGTSIRSVFKNYNCSSFLKSDFKTKLGIILCKYPKIYSLNFFWHLTAEEWEKKIQKDVYNSYYKFGFVRNLWDYQVLLYHYILNRVNHKDHQIIKRMKDFDEYINWRVQSSLHLQKNFFYKDGKCIVDFIGKFENLNGDIVKISETIGVQTNTVPHKNRNIDRKQNYLKYYSEQSFNIVKNAFREDVELFGYGNTKFEGYK